MTSPARIRTFAAALAALSLLVAGLPATAVAATHVLRPATTAYQDAAWSTVPSGTDLAAALADPVTDPTAPALDSGYAVAGSSSSSVYASVQVAAPALAAGESASALAGWFYVRAGSAQSLTLSLWSNGSMLGWRWIPAGAPAGWYEVSRTGTLSAGALADITLTTSTTGRAGNTPAIIYAAYAELTTTDPATGGAGSSPPASDPGATGDAGVSAPTPPAATTNPLTPPVLLPALPRIVTLSGPAPRLEIPVGCAAASVGGCRGTITLRVLGPAHRARHARRTARAARCARGCRDLVQGSFNVAAGRHRQVRLPIGRLALGLVPRHRRVRALLTVTAHDAVHRPSTVRRVITLQRD